MKDGGVTVVCSLARLSRGIYSQLVLSLSGREHGLKEKGFMEKGVIWMKMDVNVVRSVAGLSRGIYSQLVLSLSGDGHIVKEKWYNVKRVS